MAADFKSKVFANYLTLYLREQGQESSFVSPWSQAYCSEPIPEIIDINYTPRCYDYVIETPRGL